MFALAVLNIRLATPSDRDAIWDIFREVVAGGDTYAIDPNVDYSAEPTTLVEFRLEGAEHGTLLTVVESGFDQISLTRRASVFAENDKGWEIQMKSLDRYVGESA